MRRPVTSRVLVLAALLEAEALALPKNGAAAPAAPPVPPGLEAEPAGLPEDSGVSAARDAFRLGSALAKQGQWAEALTAFRRSAALKAHPITTYDIAYCERALGRYTRASLHFQEALAPSEDPTAAALPPELATEARKYLEEVSARVARITVILDHEDATLRVDGRPIEAVRATSEGGPYVVAEGETAVRAPSSRTFELWLDPGAHVFVVWRGEGAHVVESHAYGEGTRARLSLSSGSPPVATSPAAEERPRATAPEPSAPDRTAAWITLGIGAASLVTSGVFTGLALAEKSSLDSDQACNNRICPSSYADRESRMRTFADVATVTVIAGGVGVGLGAYLFFTARPAHSRGAHVTPYFTGTSGGIAGKF